MKRTAMSLSIVFGLMVGCTAEEVDSPDVEEGFALIQHDDTTIEATIRSGDAALHLLVVEWEPGVVDVTFDFSDTIIGFSLDYNLGQGAFMPGAGTLDATHARLIEMMIVELQELMPLEMKERTRVEQAASRQTSFMQIVPQGEKLAPFTYLAAKGWVHLSCGCYNKYIGSGYYRTCGKGTSCGGGNGCKSRCGVGCGGVLYGRGAYTRDCGKHDWGLGSWTRASDDYSFAGWNC